MAIWKVELRNHQQPVGVGSVLVGRGTSRIHQFCKLKLVHVVRGLYHSFLRGPLFKWPPAHACNAFTHKFSIIFHNRVFELHFALSLNNFNVKRVLWYNMFIITKKLKTILMFGSAHLHYSQLLHQRNISQDNDQLSSNKHRTEPIIIIIGTSWPIKFSSKSLIG